MWRFASSNRVSTSAFSLSSNRNHWDWRHHLRVDARVRRVSAARQNNADKVTLLYWLYRRSADHKNVGPLSYRNSQSPLTVTERSATPHPQDIKLKDPLRRNKPCVLALSMQRLNIILLNNIWTIFCKNIDHDDKISDVYKCDKFGTFKS